jgi:hypothetical protein
MSARRTVTLAAAALVAVASLGACSSSSSQAPVSEAPLTGTPVSAEEDAATLCASIIEQALPVDIAQILAEDSGYTTRLGTIDGEPQAVTTDFLENRLTFDTEGGIVIGCVQG